MTMATKAQPVSIGEIADLLDVKRRTVHQWRSRRVLPEPDYGMVSGIPLWERETIIQWARECGRLA